MHIIIKNINIDLFKKELGEINEKRVKFLNCQEVGNEIEEGIKLVDELKAYTSTFKKEEIPYNKRTSSIIVRMNEVDIGFIVDRVEEVTASPTRSATA